MLKKWILICFVLIILILLFIFGINKKQADWNKNTLLPYEELLADAYNYYNVKTPKDIIIKSSSNIEKNATINDYHYRGLAYHYINENEKAIEDFNKAILINESTSFFMASFIEFISVIPASKKGILSL